MSTAKQVQSHDARYVTHISETAIQRLFERLREFNDSMDEEELRDYLNDFFLARDEQNPTSDCFTHQDTDGLVRYVRLSHPNIQAWDGFYAILRRNTNPQWREFQPWVMVTIVTEHQARQSYEQFKKKNPAAPEITPLSKLAGLREKLPPAPEELVPTSVPVHHPPSERLPPFAQLPPVTALQRKVEPDLMLTWKLLDGTSNAKTFPDAVALTAHVAELLTTPSVDRNSLLTWRDPRQVRIKIELDL